MYSQEKKKNPRNTAMMLDMLHIVVGVLVVACTVLAFVNPERNSFLFPVIFWLAALLNGVNGWNRFQNGGRTEKSRRSRFVGGRRISICDRPSQRRQYLEVKH